MSFTKIDPKELSDNPFKLIGDEWALLTAGSKEDCNTMTVSWGGVGVIWGSPAATVYVRQTRYTKEYIDRGDLFTLSFFGEEHRDALALCGRVSGRDCDKIADAGIVPADFEGVAGFEEARLVLVCRKQFVQEMPESAFVDREAFERWYGDGNLHTQYIARIEAVFIKE